MYNESSAGDLLHFRDGLQFFPNKFHPSSFQLFLNPWQKEDRIDRHGSVCEAELDTLRKLLLGNQAIVWYNSLVSNT